MKIKLCRIISILMLSALCLTGIFCPTSASATGAIDPGQKASLTLHYAVEGNTVAGAAVRIYKIADVDYAGRRSLTEDFSQYQVKINGLKSDDEWNAAAETLAAYALSDGIIPLYSGHSSDKGIVRLEDLSTGLYLIFTDNLPEGKNIYKFAPTIIALPNLNEQDAWYYDVTANPKGSLYPVEDKELSYKVVKHWKNDGNGSVRPKSIEVSILRNGAVYEKKTLSSANNWSYSWNAPDDGSSWRVAEYQVPSGYTVTTEANGTTLVLTNTYGSKTPDEPAPKAGEDTNVIWFIVGLSAAGLGLILVGLTFRRRSEKNEK